MRPQQFVEDALAASTADGCVVIVAETTAANLRWAANGLTTNGQSQSRSVTVVSTFDGPQGNAAGVVTRSVGTGEELAALVRASEDAGRAAPPADDAAPLVADYASADDWAAEPARTGIEVFAPFAEGLGEAFGRWRGAGLALYGYAEHTMTSTFLGTSGGLRRRFDQPTGSLTVNGKSADLARSAWSGAHTADFADIDVAAVTAQLERRLAWAEKRVDLPAGRYETILPPTAVADLMIYAYWTASARDAEEGRSVYAAGGGGGTRIGERLGDLPLRLHSDPDYPGLECPPFAVATSSQGGLMSVFDNGTPTGPVDWIGDGRLRELIRTRAWAARTGAEPRPPVDNLILESPGAGGDLDSVIAGTERGLLLTCLWYIREVDPQTLLLTGLTRDGVYLVEDGAVTAAVNNFRFNESPVDLLGRITAIGRTERTLSREWGEYFPRTAMPAVRVRDFNMSTVSAAS
ncbi:MAG: TldD/PmbA family protein [Jatrophihabitans sp.]|nr:MAG: TldD/PmbA family protein [Jatrophihabitans sp.]